MTVFKDEKCDVQQSGLYHLFLETSDKNKMATDDGRLSANSWTRTCTNFGIRGRYCSGLDSDESETIINERVTMSSRPLPGRVERYLLLDNKARDEDLENFLNAVEAGDVDKVATMIRSKAIDVNMEAIRDRQPVTALQLAAEQNNFDLVKLLLKHGAKRIEKVGHPNREEDFHISQNRIRRYQAMINPAYLCQAFKNPLETAFNLSWELKEVATMKSTQDISKPVYLQMNDTLQQFSTGLLEECTDSQEIITVLNGRIVSKPSQYCERGCLKSPEFRLLELALQTKQKAFIASAHCQHVLRQVWLDGHPSYDSDKALFRTLLYTVFCFLVFGIFQPIIAIVYVIFPYSPVSKGIRAPKTKFLMFLFSNFFCLLLAISILMTHKETDAEAVAFPYKTDKLNDMLLMGLFVWLCGTIWSYVYQIARAGLFVFLSMPTNIIDILVLLGFLMSTLHSLLGIVDASPLLRAIVDNMPAFSIVLANIQIIKCLFPSRTLGPMLLCFFSMAGDVARFLCIFSVVTVSFAVGLYVIYSDPNNMERNDFSELKTSFMALVFSIFGRDNSSELKIAKVLLPLQDGDAFNASWNQSHVINGSDATGQYDASSMYRIFGTFMYLFFSFLVILILLNICIAMMSDTYTRVKEQIETEWKFVRTMVWVHYTHAQTLPPPFNLIPIPGCLIDLLRSVFPRWKKTTENTNLELSREDSEYGFHSRSVTDCKDEKLELNYDELTMVLLHRYLKKRNGRQRPEEEA
ncbi:short transient receptor potential channel 4-like isoform X4 [Ptychodera flava]|uniref:short transient receptor potential channel 4-like isoform X4 n=1 Tax=Ptychodera flava TaxID=63121 RepID=UPI00396A7D23